MEGALRDAENHYIEAQEWQSAVHMYRCNDLWDDAFRVAKYFGGVNAGKRVAQSLLAKHGVAEGAKYLTKYGLVEGAIEIATESGSFDMAFELANLLMPSKLPEVYMRHALFLEDEDKFPEAEQQFLKANKPKEAIDMYVHLQDWESALRVAENYDPGAVADVYTSQAKVKADSGDFAAAEELYLAASHPELALLMYQEVDMWTEALRLAQLHLPHRVAEVNMAYQAAQARAGKGGTKNDFLVTGRTLEQSKQWGQAIDSYLSAKKGKIDSVEDLEELWDRAIDIARQQVPNRHVEVAVEVARRLVELKREESAADVLFEVGRHEEAIKICIDGRCFEKAKALSQGNSELRRRVDMAFQGHLVEKEDTVELVNRGMSDVAIDVLAKQGDWERVWEVAAKEHMSTSSLGKYVLLCVDEHLKGNSAQVDNAVKVLHKRQGPATEAALRLVRSVLSRPFEEETPDHIAVVALLREVLYRLANQYRSSPGGGSNQAHSDMEELLMATHYQHMLYMARSFGLKDVAAKASITLLKYPYVVPQDKAFYQAGTMCREQGNINLAFMLLNRYVDLTEAIDTSDASFMDNSEYNDTDAIPLNGPLPTTHYLQDEDSREEVRTWVLSVVTDSSIEQRFPKREQSRGTLYEALYTSDRPTCVVTGYPVHPADILDVNHAVTNRKDWNAFVSKSRVDPWTGQAQTPSY